MPGHCPCGAVTVQDWHIFCWSCFGKLPYELRKELRTPEPLPGVVAKAKEWLESEARKQAAKIARLTQ
jgi:hypothetical protein